MTKSYDPPGITDPENVDGLTHQQIMDAFNSVANSTSELITVWKQADADLSTSTQGMLAAVRGATDGGWSGAAADAAVAMVARYCDGASQLPDLFDEVSLVVTNTAMTAVMVKSFLPPVVKVTADQSADPEGFDRQTREAEVAQAEARRIMAERYVVGFQDQDTKLPTFPAAMAIGEGQTPQAGESGASRSGGSNPSAAPQNPASTEPTGTEQAPEPEAAVDPGTEPSTDAPVGTDSESASPSSDSSNAAGGQDDSTQAAATAPTDLPSGSAPTSAVPGDPARTATPGGGGSGGGGGGGLPGGQGGSSPVPSPGAAQPPGSAGAGASPGSRGGMPAAVHAGGSGMHGMPGAAGRGGGRGDDQEKTDKKVSLTHGDNTTELLGVIKHVPPVIGDR